MTAARVIKGFTTREESLDFMSALTMEEWKRTSACDPNHHVLVEASTTLLRCIACGAVQLND